MAPITLDSAAVDKLLDEVDFLGELRGMFAELGSGRAVQPPQTLTLLPDDKGDFITYLGALTGEGVFGAKLSPYLVTGAKPIITAWTMLMSLETGEPLLICDSGKLTTERTAATTALAVAELARPEAGRLAIIGSGPIAQAHYRHVKDLRDWDQVSVFSPGLAQDADRQAIWQGLCPSITLATSAEDAVKGADAVLLCTSSGTPVVDAGALRDGVLVTSTASNAVNAHEIDPGFLTGAHVYCDYRETTPAVAGDMVLAARDHGWSVDHIRGDLPGLVTGASPKPEAGRPSFFRSIGLGLEDIAAANALYRAARA